MASKIPAIGIDLGTTNSCVGVFQNGKVEIIPTLSGNRTFPSIVSYGVDDDDDIVVGEGAKQKLSVAPHNIIQSPKRLIGRQFDDPIIQNDIRNSPVKITRSPTGGCQYHIRYKGADKIVTPEEVSSLILLEAKKYAESYLGTQVKEAVVTVPAYFKDTQRTATTDAGVISGLKIIRIINEPTSASMAYGLEKKSTTEEQNVLIFDLGGGTFDLSVIAIDEGVYEVLSTAGDSHLGGEDFDVLLLNHCANEFKRLHKKDIRSNHRSMRRLQLSCENIKKQLSSSAEASLTIDCLYEGIDFNLKVTRARFEELCNELFKNCISMIDNVLSDAKLDKSKIDEVVLVGGSTRIPKIQTMLKNYFNGKELNKSINPDESVAYGACIQGAILGGVDKINDQDIVLLDVTPLTLGVAEGPYGKMATLIKRNSRIPCKASQSFTTSHDNQPKADIQVYEGERQFVKDNRLMGNFELNLTPARRGEAKIEVTFEIDANGIMNVSATETESGASKSIQIKNENGRLSKEEIERMVKEAEQYSQIDKDNLEKVDLKNAMESHLSMCNVTSGDLYDSVNSLNSSSTLDEHRELNKKVMELKLPTPEATPNVSSTPSSSQSGPIIDEVD